MLPAQQVRQTLETHRRVGNMQRQHPREKRHPLHIPHVWPVIRICQQHRPHRSIHRLPAGKTAEEGEGPRQVLVDQSHRSLSPAGILSSLLRTTQIPRNQGDETPTDGRSRALLSTRCLKGGATLARANTAESRGLSMSPMHVTDETPDRDDETPPAKQLPTRVAPATYVHRPPGCHHSRDSSRADRLAVSPREERSREISAGDSSAKTMVSPAASVTSQAPAGSFTSWIVSPFPQIKSRR